MSAKVLLVDDEAAFLAALRRQLRKDYDIHTALNGREALNILERDGPFAVIVADMQMPGMNGVELLGEFDSRAPNTTRIMFTGRADLDTVLDAINEGSVFRFLIKPCRHEALVKAIEKGIEHHQRLVDLWDTARTDELTGASNRRHFLDWAEHEVKRARRTEAPLSAIMLDADRFKDVNDKFGHKVGDEVLCMVARVCAENLREVDIFCRYGGEEFAIFLADADMAAATLVAERLRHAIAGETVETKNGPVRITISLGVATDSGRDAELENLLERADAALYTAKRGGRNRVAVDRASDAVFRSARE